MILSFTVLKNTVHLFKSLSLFLFIFSNITAAFSQEEFDRFEVNQSGFIENLGQIRDQNNRPRTDVLYSYSSGDMSFHVKKTGISYQLHSTKDWNKEVDKKLELEEQTPGISEITRVDLEWLNSNKNCRVSKGRELSERFNYYNSSFPEGLLGISSYSDITIEDIYHDIDLHYYHEWKNIKRRHSSS